MIGALETDVLDLKNRLARAELAQNALSLSHTDLYDKTNEYIKKNDDTIYDSKVKISIRDL